MIKRELIKTGIPGFDDILGGGIPRGSIFTLSGPSGSGKSTFGMQFLVQGITKQKEPGLYISIEETKQSMHQNMSGYSWDLEKLEKNRQLVFLDYPIYEVDQFLNQYGAILEIINTMSIKRVVVDSIMPIAIHFNNDEERKKGFLKLIDNVRKWGATTMIISEDTPATTQDVLPDTKYGIESFSDGWIQIYYVYSPKDKERTRAIEVIKFKSLAHSSRIYPTEIMNNGFIVHI